MPCGRPRSWGTGHPAPNFTPRPQRLSRAALPHLGRGDCIINTASLQACQPSVTMVDYAATKEPEAVAQMGRDTPPGRIGQPAELAGAYVFLASPDEASYVSGTVLGVTGGLPVF